MATATSRCYEDMIALRDAAMRRQTRPAANLDSCCTVPSSRTPDAAAIDEIDAQDVPLEVASARAAGFRLLLETGTPVEIGDWAAAAAMTAVELAEVLDRPSVSGRVELDNDGRLLGIAGLTIKPTHHEVMIGEATRWTWCALDAVGILGALHADGTIRSINPHTGSSIEITFQSGEPDGDAFLFILGGFDGINAREAWCPLVNFFTNSQDAESWAADNDLSGDIVSIRQVADKAAAMWLPVTGEVVSQVC